MPNPSYELNSSDYEKKAREKRVSTHPPTVANLPAVAVPSAPLARPTKNGHQCPTCGAWALTGSSVCVECGTRLQQKPQKIRCRLCGATASANLVICPACGRELHAAPSRVLSWGAPAVLVCLFLVVMIQRWENGTSLQWVQTQVTSGRNWVEQLAQQLDPQITISTLPETAAQSNTAGVPLAAPANNQENSLVFYANSASSTGEAPTLGQADSATAANPLLTDTATGEPLAATQPAGAVNALALMTATIGVEETTAPALPSPEPTMSATTPPVTPTPPPPTATAPATPTAAATPTSTLRQPTAEALVEALPKTSTPLSGIGGAVTDTANAAVAPIATPLVTILQPTATVEPTPTLLPTATATATATPAAQSYTIRSGDTPLAIANQFEISVNELLAINGLSVDDARRLRVGQILIIPNNAVSATPTQPSLSPTTTPTAAQVTAAAAPGSVIRLDPPALRSPETGSSLSCSSTNSLTWLPVTFIREKDQYLLHLGFLSGYNGDGSEQVTWILEQWRPSNVTLWDLDEGLCSLAPQAFGRQWRWYIEVVEAANGSWRAVSSPSQIWGFSWN